MPYLVKPLKQEIDENGIREAADYLSTLDDRHFIGAINYLNFKIVRRRLSKPGNLSYFMFAAIVGSLMCCVMEIYRRLVIPYENQKIQQNGDVE